MKWFKAALVGALGSLLMFIVMVIGIHVTGFAPINQPPSAAFLQQLGLKIGPLPLITHFVYGMFWSVIFVAVFKDKGNLTKGLGLAGVLWLGLMLALSPIIGWGVFGTGGTVDDPNHAMYIGNTMKYIVMTLVLHIIYGLCIGLLNPLWINFTAEQQVSSTQTDSAEQVPQT